MANDSNPKDQTKQSTVFSISFEDDFEGMPGVTALLNPKSMQEKAALAQKNNPPPRMPLPNEAKKAPPSSSFSSTKTAIVNPEATRFVEKEILIPLEENEPIVSSLTVNTLSDFGVQFELHFQMERGVFRYTRMKGHARGSLSLWQEKFYFQMKLDLQALGVKEKFQEFAKGKDLFQEDVFGLMGTAAFAQVVRLGESNSQTCVVLISEKSLDGCQQKVQELLVNSLGKISGTPSGGDDEFKIELAS
jgi:hypothetical protein